MDKGRRGGEFSDKVERKRVRRVERASLSYSAVLGIGKALSVLSCTRLFSGVSGSRNRTLVCVAYGTGSPLFSSPPSPTWDTNTAKVSFATDHLSSSFTILTSGKYVASTPTTVLLFLSKLLLHRKRLRNVEYSFRCSSQLKNIMPENR